MAEGGFSADWLDLRESADSAARARPLTQTIADALPRDRPLRVIDLASGTGSNVRYLRQYLRTPQDWCLADQSAVLLEAARARLGDVTIRQIDLAHSAWRGELLRGRDLVTGSALLDLVSRGWLLETLQACRDAGATVLFALNYDGRMSCDPEDADDGLVRDLVNQHQRTDKGFGPALGPSATSETVAVLTSLGYRVLREDSDWRLNREHTQLQRLLIDGWASAATELAPDLEPRLREWRSRRLMCLEDGRSQIVVGHQDVAGLL
jgi:hypothetical protein